MNYYVYHLVPSNMEGDILYPLNVLKDKYPEIYGDALKKYLGREFVMEQTVPVLDCLWNDVLHLSPVSPLAVKEAFRELGKTMMFRAYKIDANSLDPENSIIYMHKYANKEDKYKADNWQEYSPERLKYLQQLPQRAKDYYKRMFDDNQSPLLYGFVPHVLYKGSIDISSCAIISGRRDNP